MKNNCIQHSVFGQVFNFIRLRLWPQIFISVHPHSLVIQLLNAAILPKELSCSHINQAIRLVTCAVGKDHLSEHDHAMSQHVLMERLEWNTSTIIQ